LLEGNVGQFINQAISAAAAIGIAVVGTFIIVKIVDVLIGIRVTEQDEIKGLDLNLSRQVVRSVIRPQASTSRAASAML
jgi:Amt family ammonium transporter